MSMTMARRWMTIASSSLPFSWEVESGFSVFSVIRQSIVRRIESRIGPSKIRYRGGLQCVTGKRAELTIFDTCRIILMVRCPTLLNQARLVERVLVSVQVTRTWFHSRQAEAGFTLPCNAK